MPSWTQVVAQNLGIYVAFCYDRTMESDMVLDSSLNSDVTMVPGEAQLTQISMTTATVWLLYTNMAPEMAAQTP